MSAILTGRAFGARQPGAELLTGVLAGVGSMPMSVSMDNGNDGTFPINGPPSPPSSSAPGIPNNSNIMGGTSTRHVHAPQEGFVHQRQHAKRVGMTREKTLRRLDQYMKQGMSKPDALKRLKDTLQSNSGPANPGKLAIMGIDD